VACLEPTQPSLRTQRLRQSGDSQLADVGDQAMLAVGDHGMFADLDMRGEILDFDAGRVQQTGTIVGKIEQIGLVVGVEYHQFPAADRYPSIDAEGDAEHRDARIRRGVFAPTIFAVEQR